MEHLVCELFRTNASIRIFVLEQFISMPETFEKKIRKYQEQQIENLNYRASSVSEVSFTYCEILRVCSLSLIKLSFIFLLCYKKSQEEISVGYFKGPRD